MEVQDETPKKKLWTSLNQGGFYSKSFEEFDTQFSTPEKISTLYKALHDAEYYSKDEVSFNTQFFSEGKLPEVSTPSSVNTSQTSDELTGSTGMLETEQMPSASQPNASLSDPSLSSGISNEPYIPSPMQQGEPVSSIASTFNENIASPLGGNGAVAIEPSDSVNNPNEIGKQFAGGMEVKSVVLDPSLPKENVGDGFESLSVNIPYDDASLGIEKTGKFVLPKGTQVIDPRVTYMGDGQYSLQYIDGNGDRQNAIEEIELAPTKEEIEERKIVRDYNQGGDIDMSYVGDDQSKTIETYYPDEAAISKYGSINDMVSYFNIHYPGVAIVGPGDVKYKEGIVRDAMSNVLSDRQILLKAAGQAQAFEDSSDDYGFFGKLATGLNNTALGIGAGGASLLGGVMAIPSWAEDIIYDLYNGTVDIAESITNSDLKDIKASSSDVIGRMLSKDFREGLENTTTGAVEAYNEGRYGTEDVADTYSTRGVNAAAQKLASGIGQSLPYTALLMTSGGGSASFVAGSTVMGASQYDKVSDNKDMSQIGKHINAVVSGASETGFEIIGNKFFMEPIEALFKKGGKEVAEKTIASALRSYLGKSYYLAPPVVEIATELGTTWTQNISAKLTKEDVNRKWSDGTSDTVIQTLAFSGGMTAGTMTAESIVNRSNRKAANALVSENDLILYQLENPNISPETKNELARMYSVNLARVNSYVEAELETKSKLSKSQQRIVKNLERQKEQVQKVISDQAVEEDLKVVMEEKVEAINNEIEKVITTIEPSDNLSPSQVEFSIENKELFKDGGSFSNQLGGSGIDSVLSNSSVINGIEFVQFSNPTNGEIDVVMTGTSSNDFVGFYRIYENGLPTDKWSSKFENKSKNKDNFKTMIAGVQSMLPKSHQYTETTSISTDGLRIWENQLKKGYSLQKNEDGTLITNEVSINGDSINNDLGINVEKGTFNNISVTNNKQFETVKKALTPYLEKLGLSGSNIRWENGTVKIDLPVLRKDNKNNTEVSSTEQKKLVNDKKPIEEVVSVPAVTEQQNKEVATESKQVAVVEDEVEFSSPEQADISRLRSTQDPKEVLAIYDQWENTDDSKLTFIANNLGKVNASDYASNSNKGNIIGDKRLKKWIDTKNTSRVTLDLISEDMTSRYGKEISVEDILDFMNSYDSAADYNSKKSTNNVQVEAGYVYQKLTGRNITDRALEKARKDSAKETANVVREGNNKANMSAIGVTEQEISDRQNMESEADKVAKIKESKKEGPVTSKSLLKGVSDKLKATGLAKSVKIMSSSEIDNDLKKKSNVSLQKAYHGGDLSDGATGILYVSEDENQAKLYANGNDGRVNEVDISDLNIVDESDVMDILSKNGFKPKSEDWNLEELSLFEIIDTRFETSITESELDRLQSILEKQKIDGVRFYDTNLSTLKQDIQNVAIFKHKSETLNFQKEGNSINGYVDSDGNIVINKDLAGIDTPIHEFGHIWTDTMESSNKPLFDRGMELIQSKEGDPYVAYVRSTQPGLQGDALYKEALVQAIGDSGARLIKTQERSKITEWLKAAWDYIGGLAGISGKTSQEVANMTLREYTDGVAVDLLSGKPITVVPNGDIISQPFISEKTKEPIRNVSDLSVDQKKIAEFLEKMRTRQGVKYQGTIDDDGDFSSFSDSDLIDFIDVVQSLMRTGQVTNLSELRTFANNLGVYNEGQIKYAWKANNQNSTLGIKKDLVDAQTILETPFDKLSDAEYIELGKQMVDSGLIDVNGLLRDVLTSGRVLEPYEVTALIYGRTLDQTRIDELMLIKKSDRSNEMSVELQALFEKLSDYDRMILMTANAQSAAFRLRGVLSDKDFNIISMIERMERVGEISPELRASLEALAAEMNEVKSELRIKVAELEAIKANTQTNVINARAKKSTPNAPKIESKSKSASARRDALEVISGINIADYGVSGMSFQFNGNVKFSINSSNPLMTAIQDSLSVLEADLKGGSVSLDVALEKAIDSINSAVGKGKWNELKFRSDILNKYIEKGHSPRAKKPYVDINGKVVVPTSYLKDIVAEHQSSTGSEMSVEQMSAAVQKEVGSGFSGKDILNAISLYGRAVSNTRSDEMSNITKARSIARLIEVLEEITDTNTPRSKKARSKIDARILELRKSIVDLEDSITYTPEEKAQMKYDKALDLKKKRINDYIAKIEEKIDNKDFEPERKTPLYDFTQVPEVKSLEKKREEIRNKLSAAKFKHEQENRSTGAKVWDGLEGLAFGVSRSLNAGLDLSAFMIQGGLITTSMPGASVKALRSSVGKMWSEERYEAYFHDLQTDPFFDIARKAKLNMQLPNFYQSIVEEQVGGDNLVNVLWNKAADKLLSEKAAKVAKDAFPVAAAERQYAIFLSDIRFNLFKQVAMDVINYKGVDINSEKGKAEIAKLANAVNDVTMASNIPYLDGATHVQKGLNLLFFSLRKMAANVKLVYKVPYYGGVSLVNLAAKATGKKYLADKTEIEAMIFNRIYGRVALTGLTVMAASILIPTLIANAAYDEDDEEPPLLYNPHVLNPIHSDFMKLKIGNTRFSPFLGIEGLIVLISREIRGEYMNTTSETIRGTGESDGIGMNKSRGTLIMDFLQNKLAPTPSLVAGWLGTDRDQRESNDRVAKNFIPMWMTGAWEEYETNDNPSWALATLPLSILGANFNTYGGAEFASAKGTNNKEAFGVMQKAKLSDYSPTFRSKTYGTIENGSLVPELSNDVMKKTYKPAYDAFMTSAVISNRSELLSKTNNSETKDGILMRMKRDAYAYAELKTTGYVIDKNFITFSHVNNDGERIKYRLTKSQYKEKMALVDSFKKSDYYSSDKEFAREDIIESLKGKPGAKDKKYVEMLVDLKMNTLANKWANEELSYNFVEGKYVKDTEFNTEISNPNIPEDN